MATLTRRTFDHRADLLAALVYGCLAYLSFSALSGYANAHFVADTTEPLFPQPYGGWAFAVAIDGAVLYAFISFKRAPWLAGILLVSGAAATYTLQRWHAQGALHPLMVAGVVPGLMVLVTFAWHRIRAAEPVTNRPAWDPIPPPPPDPKPDPPPDQDDPVPVLVPEARPRVAQDVSSRRRPATRGRPFLSTDHEQVRAWVDAGRSNKAEMARELGLHKRGQLDLGRFVNQVREPVRVSLNGDRS